MIQKWLDYLGRASGYKQLYEKEKRIGGEEVEALTSLLATTQNKIAELNIRLTPPDPPQIVERVSAQEIQRVLQEIFTGYSKIQLGDEHYDLTSIDEVRRFLKWDRVDLLPYIADLENISSRDCNKFADGLKGDFANSPGWWDLPVGIVWGLFSGALSGHGFCFVVCREGDETQVRFLEPQTDHEIAAETMEEFVPWLVVV